jgi:hypothetical protein
MGFLRSGNGGLNERTTFCILQYMYCFISKHNIWLARPPVFSAAVVSVPSTSNEDTYRAILVIAARPTVAVAAWAGRTVAIDRQHHDHLVLASNTYQPESGMLMAYVRIGLTKNV